MSVEIKYNGNTIASVEGGKIATIPCKGKKMAGNIVVKGDSDIKYKGATLATLSNGQTATIPCNGKIMQDNITVIAVKQLITFTINDTTYYAEEGMTWAEWCKSEYNTLNLVADSSGVHLWGCHFCAIDFVKENDVIQGGYAYDLYTGSN